MNTTFYIIKIAQIPVNLCNFFIQINNKNKFENYANNDAING